MARPERKNVDYFPHYMNHGAKMRYLFNKYGNDGYATWYKIMERLASADNHHIDLSDDIQCTFLADYCGVNEDVLCEIIEFLVRSKWLHQNLWNDHKIICSGEFIESIADAYKRRNNECINIEAIELMYYNNSQEATLMDDKNTQSKVKYSKVKNSIVVDSAKNLDFREAKFKEDVFSHDYPNYLLQAFFSYWSEPTKSKKKMRWEMQKTWDTKRRLSTWASRDDKYNDSVKATKRADSKIIRYD